MDRALKPSSASEGFFQSLPVVPPQYTSQAFHGTSVPTEPGDDPVLPRVLSIYLPRPIVPEIDQHLHEFARTCLSPHVLDLTVDAELNTPTLHSLTTFGERNQSNALRTGHGWRQLKDIGIQNGTVALGYSTLSGQSPQWNRRIHHAALGHLWTGTAALVTCPAAMSDGAAILLQRHLNDEDRDQPGRAKVLREAKNRLVSFDPAYAWSSGQWMTERSGGSDVSQTETAAFRLSKEDQEEDARQFNSGSDSIGMPLGPWKLDGFKWFSSATDANMVVLLARTAKGLSTFYAPMRRVKGSSLVMNGVRITRLKNKLGTKALPTSELEIRGMRGWLIGEEGQGIKEIAAILNATRLSTGNGAIGYWTRALAVSRAYSRVRRVKGALLQDNLQHLAWMAEQSVKYRASAHLMFLGMALLGVVEQGRVAVNDTFSACFLPDEREEAERVLRVLTPLIKAQCSLASVEGVRACMESLGGVGYCENNDDGGVMNLARIFRDANVNPIWEGTTSVMAEDVVRALKGKGGSEAIASLDALIRRLARVSQNEFEEMCSVILVAWTDLKRVIEDSDTPQLHYTGRTLLGGLEDIMCALLLMLDALVDRDEIATVVAVRWMQMRYPHRHRGSRPSWRQAAELDKKIFLGDPGATAPVKASL